MELSGGPCPKNILVFRNFLLTARVARDTIMPKSFPRSSDF
jgi:hypothetical protein